MRKGSPLYEFLHDSVLFDAEALSSNFRTYTDDDLRAELARYREHALNALAPEGAPKDAGLHVFSGTDRVPLDRLKQAALYVEHFVVNDPLFQLTHEPGDVSRTMAEGMGLRAHRLDRHALVEALGYLQELTPMVAGGYVQPYPISYTFEPPKQLPFNTSPDGFASVLPAHVLAWFRDRAEYHTVRRDEGRLLVEEGLNLGRGIAISFAGGSPHGLHVYHLHKTELADYDEASGQARLYLTLPEELPSEEEFVHWVSQSVNQAARNTFDHVTTEAAMAGHLGAAYMTPNPLAFDLLQQHGGADGDLRAHTTDMLLNVEIPFLEGVDAVTLMRVRTEEGEAFGAFRSELERHLRELRVVSDHTERAVKLENALHELGEVKVKEVNRSLRSLRRRAMAEATLGVAGFAGAVATGGMSLFAVATAAASAFKTWEEYRSKVRENPAFFLWKVLRYEK